MKPGTVVVNISIGRYCGTPRTASDNSILFCYTKAILTTLMSEFWQQDTLAEFSFLTYDWKDMPQGKSRSKQVCNWVFLYFVCGCNVNFEEIFLYSTILNPYLVGVSLVCTI